MGLRSGLSPLLSPLVSPLRRFLRCESGGAIVEGVMILPVMLAAWVGVYAFYEVFSAKSGVQKATFVAADLLSREMVPVTPAVLDGFDTAAEYLVDARFDVATRFTAFRRTGPNDTDLEVQWSYAPGSLTAPMTSSDLQGIAAQLPKLTAGTSAILVDSTMAYSLPFTVPVAGYVVPASFSDRVVMRPRFVPKICLTTSTTC